MDWPQRESEGPQRITFQQAIRAKKEQWKTSRSFSENDNYNSSAPLVTIQKMVKPNVLNKEERTANGFRESLKFFQSQEERGKVPKPESSTPNGKEALTSECFNTSTKGIKTQANRAVNPTPSVDNILNKVRTICAAQNSKPLTNPSICGTKSSAIVNGNHLDCSRMQSTTSIRTTNASTSESISNNLSSIKHNIKNETAKPSLSSRFNPSFDGENANSNEINLAVRERNTATGSSYSVSLDKEIYNSHYNGQKPVTNETQKLNGMSTLLKAEPISLQNLKNLKTHGQAGPASAAVAEQLRTMCPNLNGVSRISENTSSKANSERIVGNVLLNGKEVTRSSDDASILFLQAITKANGEFSSDAAKSALIYNDDKHGKVTCIRDKTEVGPIGDSERKTCGTMYEISGAVDDSRKLTEEKIYRSIENGKSHGRELTMQISNTRNIPPRQEVTTIRSNGDICVASPTKAKASDSCALTSSLESYEKRQNDRNSQPLWIDCGISSNCKSELRKPMLDLNSCFTQTKSRHNLDFKIPQSFGENGNGNLLSMSQKYNCSTKSNQNIDTEKGCDSLESDYDSLDFVVHKTSYSDDFVDVASEDAQSSVNEDYEVEHPDEYSAEPENVHVTHPDAPSPDYESDEDEEFLVHQGVSHYEEDEDEEYVIGSSSHYDTRRHMYYPEDKELEVIPEEDEEDLEEEEDNFYCRKYSHQGKSKDICTEADSGIPEDNSSSEDFCVEEDAVGQQQIPRYLLQVNSEFINGTVSANWDPTKKLLPLLYGMHFQHKRDKEKSPVEIQDDILVTLKARGEELDNDFTNAISPWPPREVFAKFYQGYLEIFASQYSSWPILSFNIAEGSFAFEDNAPIISDGKGTTIKIHVQDQRQAFRWYHGLLTYASQLHSSTYCIPCFPPLSLFLKVLLVDLGGTSIRAGIATSDVSLPTLYFPSVCVTKPSGERMFGEEALKPENRREGSICFPFTQPLTVQYLLDLGLLKDLIIYIATKLNVQPNEFSLMLVCNRRIKQSQKHQISAVMLDELNFQSVHVSFESYAVIAGYKRNSGIVVEVGDRIYVTPFCRGYEIPFGSSVSPYGSERLLHHLRQQLGMTNNQSFSSIPSTYILRHVMENVCYIALDYEEECSSYALDHSQFEQHMYIGDLFECPVDRYSCLSLDSGRFTVPEGLVEPSVWGLDIISLPQRIMKAVNSVPLDNRQEAVSNIIISGGLTLLPGFVERLFVDLCKLLKPYNMVPTILSSDYRLHMSYLGCHEIALRPEFSGRCVSSMDIGGGNEAFTKWAI